MLEPARREGVDRVGEDVEALFHDDPAEEGDDHFVVGDAERSPPFHVAALGVELVAVDAARPDRDVAVHALRAKDRGGRFGGRHHDLAAAIEAPHDRRAPAARAPADDNKQDRYRSGCGPTRRPRSCAAAPRSRRDDRRCRGWRRGRRSDRTRRGRGERAPGSASGMRYSDRPGIGIDGTLTRSPVGGERRIVDRRRIDPHLARLGAADSRPGG